MNHQHTAHISHSSHEIDHSYAKTRYEQDNHHDHAGMISDFRRRFLVTLIITIPVMLLSEMIQHWFGFRIQFIGSKYALLALSSVVFFYGGYPFLKGLADELKKGAPGMMTLIGVAITVAYAYSVAIVFGLQGMDFFWELCTLILIMLLGHWIEMKSIAGASRELELLVQLMPSNAHMIHGSHIMEVKTDSLKEGDLILIKPGENIAADGTITEGESYVNESMLTGESIPVKKQKGDKVIAGSINGVITGSENGSGSLKVSVSHASKDSYLSRVIKLIDEAQKTKSKTQLLADKAARILTIVALAAGFATFIFWWTLGAKPFEFAMERMVTVIVICCPHALGLAVPLVVAVSTSLSAKNGLLIKNRTAFENARKITTIIFDKTGTLTLGSHEVTRIISLDSKYKENEILRLAAGVEQNSEHYIGKGILKKMKEENLPIPSCENFEYTPGVGVKGKVEGKLIQSGGSALLKKLGLSYSDEAVETRVFVFENEKLIGFIAFADKIRDTSYQAIKTLHDNGIKAILLTGDNAKIAKSVSDTLTMDGYFAEVLPHQKLEKIKELQGQGEFVAMTGDGVNDAPALAQADVGIAVGSGSDIAAETAGIVLVNSDPKDITSLILFGKATYKKMTQNLAWATGYNIIALPLAAGVLFKWDILLSPAIGAVLMSLSTVIVAVNAKLLRVK
ncbi:MAG: cadmium-translocating P-type ATPase [Bacteroidetes bacterium]|nr:cadmium-translocating P-type ATPase [Bacteroidota bacterium]